jgi:hypothetical protein
MVWLAAWFFAVCWACTAFQPADSSCVSDSLCYAALPIVPLLLPDVEWDPTGRYVASSVTSIHQMENGFNMWSFNGKLLYK